jgi:hypothetical protein
MHNIGFSLLLLTSTRLLQSLLLPFYLFSSLYPLPLPSTLLTSLLSFPSSLLSSPWSLPLSSISHRKYGQKGIYYSTIAHGFPLHYLPLQVQILPIIVHLDRPLHRLTSSLLSTSLLPSFPFMVSLLSYLSLYPRSYTQTITQSPSLILYLLLSDMAFPIDHFFFGQLLLLFWFFFLFFFIIKLNACSNPPAPKPSSSNSPDSTTTSPRHFDSGGGTLVTTPLDSRRTY